jgi:hypothetical protein
MRNIQIVGWSGGDEEMTMRNLLTVISEYDAEDEETERQQLQRKVIEAIGRMHKEAGIEEDARAR